MGSCILWRSFTKRKARHNLQNLTLSITLYYNLLTVIAHLKKWRIPGQPKHSMCLNNKSATAICHNKSCMHSFSNNKKSNRSWCWKSKEPRSWIIPGLESSRISPRITPNDLLSHSLMICLSRSFLIVLRCFGMYSPRQIRKPCLVLTNGADLPTHYLQNPGFD